MQGETAGTGDPEIAAAYGQRGAIRKRDKEMKRGDGEETARDR